MECRYTDYRPQLQGDRTVISPTEKDVSKHRSVSPWPRSLPSQPRPLASGAAAQLGSLGSAAVADILALRRIAALEQ